MRNNEQECIHRRGEAIDADTRVVVDRRGATFAQGARQKAVVPYATQPGFLSDQLEHVVSNEYVVICSVVRYWPLRFQAFVSTAVSDQSGPSSTVPSPCRTLASNSNRSELAVFSQS